MGRKLTQAGIKKRQKNIINEFNKMIDNVESELKRFWSEVLKKLIVYYDKLNSE